MTCPTRLGDAQYAGSKHLRSSGGTANSRKEWLGSGNTGKSIIQKDIGSQS